MSDLPRSITIGPFVYTVTDDDTAHAVAVKRDGVDTWGSISYGLGTIALEPNQNAAHKRVALLHETMHGCWHLTDKQHADDEAAIRILAAPMLDMLRRNPDLVAYLMAEDSE